VTGWRKRLDSSAPADAMLRRPDEPEIGGQEG